MKSHNFCPECGQSIDEGVNNCPKCGELIVYNPQEYSINKTGSSSGLGPFMTGSEVSCINKISDAETATGNNTSSNNNEAEIILNREDSFRIKLVSPLIWKKSISADKKQL